MTARDLERMASELGLDAVGATPAEPYEGTERHIRERQGRGLFADMKFTMAQPEVSCHPEKLLPGARTVVSAEVLISITGLELAFVVAPSSMKSFVTALWLMTVAIANFFINAQVLSDSRGLRPPPPGQGLIHNSNRCASCGVPWAEKPSRP